VLLASSIFLATLVLVIWQPKGLPIGWIALGGAGIALSLGVVHWADVPVVWHIVWDATFTLIGLIVISLLLDGAGFFEWAALQVARRARGRGHHLFLLTVFLGAATAAFLANDGAVLILTPLVLEMLHALRFTPRATAAFALAIGFVSDAASLPLKISNLTNIIVANYFGISFVDYAEVMIMVNAVALLATFVVLWSVFRKDIPGRFDIQALPDPKGAIRDPLVFHAGWVVLLCMLAGYLAAHALGLATSIVTGVGAMVLLLAAAREHLLRRQPKAVIPVMTLLREAPWQVVVFSLGMYLVVFGLRNQGLTAGIARGLEGLASHGEFVATLGAGLLFAMLSAVMNNLPTVLVGSLAIHDAAFPSFAREALIYANVVGCNLGPKMTPIGSLATLLWLHVLAQRGVKIGWLEFCRVGVVLTLPVLLATLIGLFLWLRVIR
jgi:arsenical pump membrane protein